MSIEARPTGPLVADRGALTRDTLPPAGFIPPLPGNELRRNRCSRPQGSGLPDLLAHQDVLHQRLRLHRPVHRALVRDLQQPAALFLVQGTFELYLALDAVDPSFLRLALLAVGGVNSVLRE